MKILCSNDDGIKSMGIDALAKEIQELGDVIVVAPDRQQTARAKALTFHRPLRIKDAETASGMSAISYDSPPANSVFVYKHFHGQPDLVVSGINSGDNTSIHSILTSGTCAVAMEAGMQGVPAIAYSMDVPDKFFYSLEVPGELKTAALLSKIIAKVFLKASKEYWDAVMFLNVNFPKQMSDTTKTEYAELETHKYENYLVERVDPSGRKYFWIWGDKRETYNKAADSYMLYHDHVTTVSPVSFDGKAQTNIVIDETRQLVEKVNMEFLSL